ncbi:MAG: DsrE family protein [Alphaproteobacteria bacterium]
MAAEAETDDGPGGLSIIVFSGDFDRVHYAFSLAAAAAATNRAVTLFFTMGAARVLLAPDADGSPAWHRLTVDPGRPSPTEIDADYGARGVARIEVLIAACTAFGVRVLVCEMGLRALGMEDADLRPDLTAEVGGIVTFLADASAKGGMLFV